MTNELACSHTATLFVLAEQHMTRNTFQNVQRHPHPGPIIPADSLRRHSHRFLGVIADVPDRFLMNSVQMRHQQDWHAARGIKIPRPGYQRITPAVQPVLQQRFQFRLSFAQNGFKSGGVFYIGRKKPVFSALIHIAILLIRLRVHYRLSGRTDYR